MADQQRILYSIVNYLKSLKQDGEEAESLDVTIGLLESNFGVEDTSDNFLNSYSTTSLSDIFNAGVTSLNLRTASEALESVQNDPKFGAFLDLVTKKGYFNDTEIGSTEYLKRQMKLVVKFQEKAASAGPSEAEILKLAEEKKGLGNVAISGKDYEGAIQYYSEALELSPEGVNSHIYYCNRAAAHCHLNNYIEAVDDCNASIALKPDYVKSHSRLGLANYFLER
jgi:small glutamine-rich tetratricopeptide repeat-containing protein alpha